MRNLITVAHAAAGYVSAPSLPFNSRREWFDQRFASFHAENLVRPAALTYGAGEVQPTLAMCAVVPAFSVHVRLPTQDTSCDTVLCHLVVQLADQFLMATNVAGVPARTLFELASRSFARVSPCAGS
jgi:hypothetical protein